VVDIIIIDGGLPDFLGASCSGSSFSAAVVLRGAKNLRFNIVFRQLHSCEC
jgi:hypothetical protein